jgi:hypothetical protein
VIAMTTNHIAREPGLRRSIGPIGTLARIAVGLALIGSVTAGHIAGTFHPWPWLLGLVGFPGVVVAWQQWRARRHPSRMDATGPVAHLANIAVFLALYLTTWYAPALSITSDAALLFYGASMLLAAARGYAGCEVLALSNWLLRRDDQVGCMVFGPVDAAEQATRRTIAAQ